MEWVRQHSNGSLIRCYRAIGPERSFRYVFSYLFRVLKFHHLPNTHTQSDPHDAKTLIRTKLKFSLPPSSLNSRKILSVSPKDAEVDLKGRGDSLYLGKYRKIKIPFEITNAKFNWKTRRIEFLLQNDGLSNTRRVRSLGAPRARFYDENSNSNTKKHRYVSREYSESVEIPVRRESWLTTESPNSF